MPLKLLLIPLCGAASFVGLFVCIIAGIGYFALASCAAVYLILALIALGLYLLTGDPAFLRGTAKMLAFGSVPFAIMVTAGFVAGWAAEARSRPQMRQEQIGRDVTFQD